MVTSFLDMFYFSTSWTIPSQVDLTDIYCPFDLSADTLSAYQSLVHAFIQANGFVVALWCNFHMIRDFIASLDTVGRDM